MSEIDFKIKKRLESLGLQVSDQELTHDQSLALVESLPPQVSHVKVLDSRHNIRWRGVGSLREDDVLIFESSGNLCVKQVEVSVEYQEYLDFMESDSLVSATKEKGIDSPMVINEAMARLSEVASSLSYERKKAQLAGQSASMIARREVTALVAIKDTALKRIDQRLRKQDIDLDSLAFRQLFVFIVQTFQEAMENCGVAHEDISSVISELSTAVDTEEWRAIALKVVQGDHSTTH